MRVRSITASRSVAIAFCCVVISACDVGDVTQGRGAGTGGGGGGVDAGAGSPGGDAAPAAADCAEPVTTALPSGEHNAGLSCMTAGCHDAGGEGPTYTVGGTIYNAVSGGQPLPGATIRIVDANGGQHELISAQNGNFWTSQQIAFPIQVDASSCPNTTPMIGAVQQAGGSCNQNGCHTANLRVWLP